MCRTKKETKFQQYAIMIQLKHAYIYTKKCKANKMDRYRL